MKILIISDAKMTKSNKINALFNSIAYEMEHLMDCFSKCEIIGVESAFEPDMVILNDSKYVITSIRNDGIGINGFSFFYLLELFFKSLLKVPKYDVIHVRGPGVPMFYGIIFSIIFPQKKWWFKYANDWSSWGKSSFWDLQKVLLSKFFWIKVTINGKWLNQPKHILSFENPCIWNISNKSHQGWQMENLRVIFVGRLTNEKGILIALKCFETICSKLGEKVKIKFTIIGEGPLSNFIAVYKSELDNLEISYLGTLSKNQIFEFYGINDFIILPTLSPEGFPKSIAEAMSFGCIPIVTAVSSIPQYIINGENGFLISENPTSMAKEFEQTVMNVIDLQKDKLIEISNNARMVAEENFTYDRFIYRVKSELIF